MNVAPLDWQSTGDGCNSTDLGVAVAIIVFRVDGRGCLRAVLRS